MFSFTMDFERDKNGFPLQYYGRTEQEVDDAFEEYADGVKTKLAVQQAVRMERFHGRNPDYNKHWHEANRETENAGSRAYNPVYRYHNRDQLLEKTRERMDRPMTDDERERSRIRSAKWKEKNEYTRRAREAAQLRRETEMNPGSVLAEVHRRDDERHEILKRNNPELVKLYLGRNLWF